MRLTYVVLDNVLVSQVRVTATSTIFKLCSTENAMMISEILDTIVIFLS